MKAQLAISLIVFTGTAAAQEPPPAAPPAECTPYPSCLFDPPSQGAPAVPPVPAPPISLNPGTPGGINAQSITGSRDHILKGMDLQNSLKGLNLPIR